MKKFHLFNNLIHDIRKNVIQFAQPFGSPKRLLNLLLVSKEWNTFVSSMCVEKKKSLLTAKDNVINTLVEVMELWHDSFGWRHLCLNLRPQDLQSPGVIMYFRPRHGDIKMGCIANMKNYTSFPECTTVWNRIFGDDMFVEKEKFYAGIRTFLEIFWTFLDWTRLVVGPETPLLMPVSEPAILLIKDGGSDREVGEEHGYIRLGQSMSLRLPVISLVEYFNLDIRFAHLLNE